MTPNQITNLLEAGALLALDGPDGLKLPAWPFDPEAGCRWLEGIPSVAAAFPGQVPALSSWMVVPHPSLGGRTPRQGLLDGDVELVAAIASHHGARPHAPRNGSQIFNKRRCSAVGA